MKRIVKWMLVLIVLASLCGCIKTYTPEGKPQWKLDPNATQKAEDATETAISILGLLGTLWPILLPVATAGAAGLATWKKIKPKLIEAQSEAKMYHSVSSSVVLGIEEFKKHYPDRWNNLLIELENVKAKLIKPEDTLKLENIIRGLRGLPPKE